MLLKTKLKAVGKVLKEVSKSLRTDLNALRSGLQQGLCCVVTAAAVGAGIWH